MSHKTAAVLVIGDEILKGQVVDTNASFIVPRLFAIGVRVCRIVVVPDTVEEIASELQRLYIRYDFVITTGGIGPTHDDVTYQGIANAVGESLVLNDEMSKTVSRLTKSCHAQKMAMLPTSATLIPVQYTDFPVVCVRNIFILPGIPKWCQAGFLSLLNIFSYSGSQFFVQDLKLLVDEVSIIPQLNLAVEKFKGKVSFGSYPTIHEDGSLSTLITMDSSELEDVCAARAFLVQKMPSNFLNVKLAEEDALKVINLTSGSSAFSNAVAKAVKVIQESLLKYRPNEIVLSFNGGKDCTALLHLVWAVLKVNKSGPLRALYVSTENPFPEIVSFIEECATYYALEMEKVAGPIKPALEAVVTASPQVKAVWMGTRRTDPYAKDMNHFQMCDPGWPQVERVCPLLDWSYRDVWTFLRLLSVPYCKLYDEGYTSLGHRGNTSKNADLLDRSTMTYKPAYYLLQDKLERNGRK